MLIQCFTNIVINFPDRLLLVKFLFNRFLWKLPSTPECSRSEYISGGHSQKRRKVESAAAIKSVLQMAHCFWNFYPRPNYPRVVQYLKEGSPYRLFKLYPEMRKRYWGGCLQFDFLFFMIESTLRR